MKLVAATTGLLLVASLPYLAYVYANRNTISPGDFGSLLEGIFSPIVLLWIVYTAHLQYRALQDQSLEADQSRDALRRARLIDLVNKCTDPRGLHAIRTIMDRVADAMPGNWPRNINKLHDNLEIHAAAIQHLDALELASIAVLARSVDEDEARALLERHLISAFNTIQFAMPDWRDGAMKGVASYNNLQTLSQRWVILNTGLGEAPPLEPVLTREQRLGTLNPVHSQTNRAK